MDKWICLKDHGSAVTTTIMPTWVRDSLALNITSLSELQRGENNRPEKILHTWKSGKKS